MIWYARICFALCAVLWTGHVLDGDYAGAGLWVVGMWATWALARTYENRR